MVVSNAVTWLRSQSEFELDLFDVSAVSQARKPFVILVLEGFGKFIPPCSTPKREITSKIQS